MNKYSDQNQTVLDQELSFLLDKLSSTDETQLTETEPYFDDLFKKINFEDLSNDDLTHLIIKYNDIRFHKYIIKKAKAYRSKEYLKTIIEIGELSLAKKIFKELINYCEEYRLYKFIQDLLDELGYSVLSKNEVRSYKAYFSVMIGDIKLNHEVLPKHKWRSAFNRLHEKKVFYFAEKERQNFLNAEVLLDLAKEGSPGLLYRIGSFIGGMILWGKLDDKQYSTLEQTIIYLENSKSFFYTPKEQDDKKVEKIKEIVSKIKVISNLKRHDLLPGLLEDLRDLDDENAWLKYLEEKNNVEETLAVVDEIEKSYSGASPLEDKSSGEKLLVGQVRDLMSTSDVHKLSDLYYLSHVLNLHELSLEIADQVINSSKNEQELVNGLVLKIRANMSMRRWLVANDLIDQMFEEMPLKKSEKQTIIRMKVKCLEMLGFHEEAKMNRNILDTMRLSIE